MSFVGLLGLLTSVVAAFFAFPDRQRGRYVLSFGILILHLMATVTSFIYDLSHDADAKGYYFDPYGLSAKPFSFGTVFLVKSVQGMRATIGGSYFEYFLLFQSIGFIGIVLLSRIISDIRLNTNLPDTKWAILVLFLPSMHFWTSAIGKDAPLFLATSMTAWAILRFSSRWFWFALSLLIMTTLRMHIAFVAVISLMLSLFLDKRYDLGPRLLFFAIALISSGFIIRTMGSKFGFSASNPNSVVDFISSVRNSHDFLSGSNTSVSGGFVVRLFSLLFRPFFIDSPNAFGLISSMENVFFLVSSYLVLTNIRSFVKWFQRYMSSKYFICFTIVLTVLLAMVYYNVGLGLRQRVMVYPTLLPIFVIAWAIWGTGRRTRSSAKLAARVDSSALPGGGYPTAEKRLAPGSPHPNTRPAGD